ncbi:MAG: hypothetical protein A3D26_04815 [Candidatus Blackburnbacteria bacterium RIFCSPHIGHO2_02_FULL_44_20]|uniref:Uncharacterized protein n=1 Tax=Candidatus Blackburnbacteria bacterium RIFCSPHIGHO2_02_FULL_44_20 TaxID=1797516 RepID=A0A1G1V4H0_9BACT|nr:MAG: hypothetical protein A3D26_04815 [Candidatus Blackburnbacteria bacterium RIFCSPHIGHO2_02_FULL_44_20]
MEEEVKVFNWEANAEEAEKVRQQLALFALPRQYEDPETGSKFPEDWEWYTDVSDKLVTIMKTTTEGVYKITATSSACFIVESVLGKNDS